MDELKEIIEELKVVIKELVVGFLNYNPNYTRKEMLNLVNKEIEKHLVSNELKLGLEEFEPLVKKVIYQLVAP